MNDNFQKLVDYIREIYKTDAFLPIHEPRFWGNEKKYLNECIDSTFVSSVGKFVDRIEDEVAKYTGAKKAIAVVNGTAALHISLKLVGVESNCEVITQALTFIATANAISYCNATPVFVDVDKDTLGMSPESLLSFLDKNTFIDNKSCFNKVSRKKIAACVPMHTFGHPCRIDEIVAICDKYYISVVEDSAESIGSYYKGKHTGTFGKVGVLSFNGNKTITSGGGGMIITNDIELAKKAKYMTTTAKIPHKWEYRHDIVGYNYRMPNINAALAVAQLEQLDKMINLKRKLATKYIDFCRKHDINVVKEPCSSISNYWLNAVILKDKEERESFLEYTNSRGIMTRPIWTLMNKLVMFKDCQKVSLVNSEWLENRIVNITSSVVE